MGSYSRHGCPHTPSGQSMESVLPLPRVRVRARARVRVRERVREGKGDQRELRGGLPPIPG